MICSVFMGGVRLRCAVAWYAVLKRNAYLFTYLFCSCVVRNDMHLHTLQVGRVKVVPGLTVGTLAPSMERVVQ
jgi:hypothetical protein